MKKGHGIVGLFSLIFMWCINSDTSHSTDDDVQLASEYSHPSVVFDSSLGSNSAVSI